MGKNTGTLGMSLVEVAIALAMTSIVALGVTAVTQNLAVGVRSAGASGELQTLFSQADLLLSDPQRCASVLRNGSAEARFNGNAELDLVQGKNVDRIVFPSPESPARELLREGGQYSGHVLSRLRFVRKSAQLNSAGDGNHRYIAALLIEFQRSGAGIGASLKSREILMELEVPAASGLQPVLHCKLSSRTEEQLCSDMGGTWNKDFSPKCLLDTYFGIARSDSERTGGKLALPNERGLYVQGAARIESVSAAANHAQLDVVRSPGTHTGSAQLAVINRSSSNSAGDRAHFQLLREYGEGAAELHVQRLNGNGNAELRLLRTGSDGTGLAHLSVQSNGNSYVDSTAHSANRVPYFRVQRSLGSAGALINLPNGEDSQLGWFAGMAYVGDAFREVARIGFRLEGKDAGEMGATNHPGAIVFRVRPPNDVSSDGVVGMYLNPQGNLQVRGAITGLAPGVGPKIGADAQPGDVLTASDSSGTSAWKGFRTWTMDKLLTHTTASGFIIDPARMEHNGFVYGTQYIGGPAAKVDLNARIGKTPLFCSLSVQRQDIGKDTVESGPSGLQVEPAMGGSACLVEKDGATGRWMLIANSWNAKHPESLPWSAPERFPKGVGGTGAEGPTVQCNATCLYLE